MDGEPQGEIVAGVNPKRKNNVGQTFVFKPTTPLVPGEYALAVGGMFLFGTCDNSCPAFGIVK